MYLSEQEKQELFFDLYNAKDEDDVDKVIEKYSSIFNKSDQWQPLGQTHSNYSIVKNQQSDPIAAIIEKITNSIDALLTRKCEESKVYPTSKEAPQSMQEAVEKFFPKLKKNWDVQKVRREHAEEIQVIADGKGPRTKKNYPTSVIVYDNGEGQSPENFEKTFLSLIRKNKNDIPFVQGKYNMGGSGALVFCGKKRYHLIASKSHKGGNFGFTLIREHKMDESENVKETWYEYLIPDGEIMSFPIDTLDLGLNNREFKTGTILKLYSYQFPAGYSAFSQDLNQSINEFLFKPALPILTKDTAERYPKNKVLDNDLYGLDRRLRTEEKDYLEVSFQESYTDDRFREIDISCFVFKNKIRDFDLKKSRETIRNRYFKNNMSVVFSLNGQVHGHFTSEFITRSLKMNLLKNYLLIHVDCTKMKYEFRKELFMASRDRLKGGEEVQFLRQILAKKLGNKKGRLAEIEKQRKNAADVDTSSNTQDLLKDLTRNMPMDSDMMKLLEQTFDLDRKDGKGEKKKSPPKHKKKKEEKPFTPKRFPSYFSVKANGKNEQPVAKIPEGKDKDIKFDTDVENEYFDRVEDPGELELTVLKIRRNNTSGGDESTGGKDPGQIFNVTKRSPQNGEIKVGLQPKSDLEVGDEVEINATLTAPEENFSERFWVKITEPEQPKEKNEEKEDTSDIGLPDLVWARQEKDEGNNIVSWDDVEEATGKDMNYETVMVPQVVGDKLEKVFVNMESRVLMDQKSKGKGVNEEQREIINRKYYTSVYFHTLFLYTITRNRKYQIYQEQTGKNEPEPVDLEEYLQDLFDHYYSDFLMNFQMDKLMEGLGD